MKGKILVVMLAVIALLVAGVALADVISNSKHNLSSTGTGTVKALAAEQNGQICIWCHTPHGSNTAYTPLWNKQTAASTYTMYGNTIAGTAPDASPAGVSKACLSCHDGVAGVNSLMNPAGSGGSAGLVLFNNVATARLISGAPNLGITLVDDHPVSMVYTETTKASLKVKTTALTGWIGASTINGLLRGASGNV